MFPNQKYVYSTHQFFIWFDDLFLQIPKFCIWEHGLTFLRGWTHGKLLRYCLWLNRGCWTDLEWERLALLLRSILKLIWTSLKLFEACSLLGGLQGQGLRRDSPRCLSPLFCIEPKIGQVFEASLSFLGRYNSNLIQELQLSQYMVELIFKDLSLNLVHIPTLM